jgi:tetratricopeptide (TPR) repeat protein
MSWDPAIGEGVTTSATSPPPTARISRSGWWSAPTGIARAWRIGPTSPRPSPAPAPAPPWLDEHLLGFAIECKTADAVPSTDPARATESVQARSLAKHREAERALRHYRNSLSLRPDSYWGSYRAAAICYGLGRVDEAAGYLERCLDRRPENSTLQGQLAGCLIHLNRYSEALALCDRVLEKAPDHFEFYRTRAFVRAKLGQIDGLADDIRSLEICQNLLPRSLQVGEPEPPNRGGLPPLAVGDLQPRSVRRGTLHRAVEVDPEEIDKRAILALEIAKAGAFEIYRHETDKILLLDPDYIPARTMRVEQAIETGQFDRARRELDTILKHPRLMEHLRGSPDGLKPFHNITRLYLHAERLDDA